MSIKSQIGNMGLVPVVVFNSMDDVLPTAEAMIAGGLPIMEITLRTEHGIPAIKKISETYPNILLGAGTVLSVDQAKQAITAGARFIVSPGINEDVVKYCNDNDVLITPGAVTPTEIEMGLGLGLKTLKFFPASIYGGVNACKALYGPYRMISFIPTGGVSLGNLGDYTKYDFIHAIGGGWLCSGKDIADGNYGNISSTIKQSITILLSLQTDSSKAKEIQILNDKLNGIIISEGSVPEQSGSNDLVITTNNIDRAQYYLEANGFVTKLSSCCSIAMSADGIDCNIKLVSN